jgi:hypothetical protein
LTTSSGEDYHWIESFCLKKRISKHIHIYIISDLQFNDVTRNSEEEDDFHIKLSSSYSFTLKSTDLGKLTSIRAAKINKKRCRLFQEMGLPIEVDKTSVKKKIFISKKRKTTSTTTGSGVETSGNLI